MYGGGGSLGIPYSEYGLFAAAAGDTGARGWVRACGRGTILVTTVALGAGGG